MQKEADACCAPQINTLLTALELGVSINGVGTQGDPCTVTIFLCIVHYQSFSFCQ
jgi:hypothetical protein